MKCVLLQLATCRAGNNVLDISINSDITWYDIPLLSDDAPVDEDQLKFNVDTNNADDNGITKDNGDCNSECDLMV